jgi:hypothetical protein
MSGQNQNPLTQDLNVKKDHTAAMVNVLLIGEHPQRASYLRERLQERKCEFGFATSFEMACALLKTQDYDIVLSPTRLHGKSCLPLMNVDQRDDVSFFFAQPAEENCWWLPALQRGTKCFGSNALRPSEFFHLLIDTVEQLQSCALKATV